jgi:PBP1b-binding outer membrane lipoprotein LpoB
MKRLLLNIVGSALLLGGCADLQPRTGAPLQNRWPQATEQCHAQPKLAWC